MLQEEEFRPHWIYNFLFRPTIKLFSINERILLTEQDSQRVIAYSDIEEIKLEKGLFLDAVSFQHSSGEKFLFKGLTRYNADRVQRLLQHGKFLHSINNQWLLYEAAHIGWKSLCSCERYVPDSQYRTWFNAYKKFDFPDFTGWEASLLAASDKSKMDAISELQHALKHGRKIITECNESFVQKELKIWESFLDSIESHPLTDRQRLAVVHDEDNTLVVAGAGTGKTSTIISKVGYIIKKGLASPEEILLLSFTGKAADEMRDRIKNKFQISLNVRTFHSLGLEVISKATNKKPNLCKEASDDARMRNTLTRILNERLKDKKFRDTYITFQTLFWTPYKAEWEFKTLAEYKNYLENNNIRRALSGDLVKSFEECVIANWLYLNGVSFEYEAKYRIDVASLQYRQYTPDFYLPDYDIYLEHFGIARDGKTAPFVDKQRYHADMQWKRQIHRLHKTTLIETFSWEHKEKRLISGLKRKLLEKGVVLKLIPTEEVLAKINELGKVEPLVQQFSTFQRLFKGNACTKDALLERAKVSENTERAKRFLKLFFDVHESYEERNKQKGVIDFEDMIRQSSDFVTSSQYTSPFRYILVDEFQDISMGRAKLLTALRDQVKDTRLFCVGDDWQSIYRFTGSDIGLMTQFHKAFGYTKRIDLNRTFRFNDRIEALSTRFILRNPSQLKKELLPHIKIQEPAVFLQLCESRDECIEMLLAEIDKEVETKSSVFVLDRYNYKLPSKADQDRYRKQFEKLELSFLTAHSSKGLEADYVILNHLVNGTYGFPCEIVDDPLLKLVLSDPDKYENGEERRLFYVAVSRAKKKVFLVSDSSNCSSFVRELIDDDGYEVIVNRNSAAASVAKCPECGSGILLPRMQESNGVTFYGCSNYPLCTHTEDACPQCHQGLMSAGVDLTVQCSKCDFEGRLCPQCKKGWLEQRAGKYGPFLGCSMYRSRENQCTYTENVS